MQPDFKKMNGLVPAIVQDYKTGRVLMLAYMDEWAWNTTLSKGKAAFYSRSRQKAWIKGETSGNYQNVKEIFLDCDQDTVLLKVEQKGNAACHLGYNSCFFTKIENGKAVINEKKIFDPEKVYKQKE